MRKISSKRFFILTVSGLAVTLVIVGLLQVHSNPLEDSGDTVPTFSVVDIDGEFFELESYHGKILVLNFMATWCPACREETSELTSVWLEYQHTILIVSISVSVVDTIERIREFRSSHTNATWVWLSDTENIAANYEIRTIPTTILIDKNGLTKSTYTSFVDSTTLKKAIQQLLS